jgi:hypothetical protein
MDEFNLNGHHSKPFTASIALGVLLIITSVTLIILKR